MTDDEAFNAEKVPILDVPEFLRNHPDVEVLVDILGGDVTRIYAGVNRDDAGTIVEIVTVGRKPCVHDPSD